MDTARLKPLPTVAFCPDAEWPPAATARIGGRSRPSRVTRTWLGAYRSWRQLGSPAPPRVLHPPSPSCPSWFAPHEYTAPPIDSTSVWAVPAEAVLMASAPRSTRSGTLLRGSSKSPTPSWPYRLLPNVYTRPNSATTTVCSYPSATSSTLIFAPPAACIGTRTGAKKLVKFSCPFSPPVPRPSCPCSLRPHMYRSPSPVMPALWSKPLKTLTIPRAPRFCQLMSFSSCALHWFSRGRLVDRAEAPSPSSPYRLSPHANTLL